jgi:hypothetical protein
MVFLFASICWLISGGIGCLAGALLAAGGGLFAGVSVLAIGRLVFPPTPVPGGGGCCAVAPDALGFGGIGIAMPCCLL